MKLKRCTPVLAALLLAGCAAGDTESLLRAPQLSGQGSAVQRALSSYLGSGVTPALKYPASGDFLSPFLFGDWDGDGEQEAAVLYTAESTGANAWLAVLEPAGDGWQVSQTAEGLSAEVESITTAHLRDADSLQILIGYGSAQGDRYLVVYSYSEQTLQTVIKRAYTDMILADMTGGLGAEDLVLALPAEAEAENPGVNLDLLTYLDGEFRSAQTLAVGAGTYSGCAGLHAGQGIDGKPWLVVDGQVGTSGNSVASTIVQYDEESGFLQIYSPPGAGDLSRTTLRYDTSLQSMDIDGDGTIDIPSERDDGGILSAGVDKRLRLLQWQDYTTDAGGTTTFGVYDSEYRLFLPLPASLYGEVLLRSNQAGTGWMVCTADGTTIYLELRLVPPDSGDDAESEYNRIGFIGDQQLQVRLVTRHYGLTLDGIKNGLVLLE